MKRFFFIGIVIGVATLFLAWLGFLRMIGFDMSFDNSSNYTVLEKLNSPNEQYTAFAYVESGGGAAGWCFERVCIDNSNYFPYSEEYDVFEIVPAQTDLQIKWIGTNTLEITYHVTQDYTTVYRNQSRQFKGVSVIFNPIFTSPSKRTQ